MRRTAAGLVAAAAVLFVAATVQGRSAPPGGLLRENGAPIVARRAAGPIVVDGEVSEVGWQSAGRVDSWYETVPGDNVPAAMVSVARLAYDETYLYVAFEFEDPDPEAIRAPLLDRDGIPPSVDFGGLYVDTAGEGQLAQEFACTPRGVQYDGVYSESSGPDGAPDFFWECAGLIHAGGWSLEMRIPFASLRYSNPDPASWGILMYRCIPRAYRYEYYSARMPRDRACSLCNALPLEGLSGLPAGSHWVAAPYVSASQVATSSDGLGSSLDRTVRDNNIGFDLKWIPSPSTVVDAAWNPDFSQVESDEAQITANERFALFFDEKRPFFMESKDLFTTPISAVHTRTITSPRWGVRTTGAGDGYTYTLLAGEDRGGGSVILPGAEESSFAPQDFSSFFAIGRFRKGVGRSFASLLFTDREVEGGGYNRVVGPDFEWWPSDVDVILGQLLWSWTQAPNRPELASEWTGGKLAGHAGELTWLRRTGSWDAALSYQDISDEFRADNGFVPQVGFRKGYAEGGYTFWPKESPITRLRLFTFASDTVDQEGRLLYRRVTPGFGFDSILDSFVRFEFAFEEVRAGERVFRRNQVRPTIRLRPGRTIPLVELQATVGDEVDFANSRLGDGVTLRLASEVRAGDHLQLYVILNRRWLDVQNEGLGVGRLFNADVARLKATYSFSVRSWLRLIGEWVEMERDPARYLDPVEPRSGDLAGSLTFAYKLNWQTVLYLGLADTRALDETETLQPADRQAFLKLSYAFQR